MITFRVVRGGRSSSIERSNIRCSPERNRDGAQTVRNEKERWGGRGPAQRHSRDSSVALDSEDGVTLVRAPRPETVGDPGWQSLRRPGVALDTGGRENGTDVVGDARPLRCTHDPLSCAFVAPRVSRERLRQF